MLVARTAFNAGVGQLANQPDRLLEAADPVITVGYDPVEYWPSLWNEDRDRKIIHVDVLPADLDSHNCPAIELVGDIAQSLSALKLLLDRKEQSPISPCILHQIREERAQLGHKVAPVEVRGAPGQSAQV